MNKKTLKEISLKQKITLIIFGLFLCVVLLEVGLRIGGFVFLFPQEYRNRISIKQKGAYRIMCLGDSLTAGMYPGPLEEVLNERIQGIKFTVIDKGRPAATSDSVISTLNENLDKYNPDMVVVMMGFNDRGEVLPDGNIPTSKEVPFRTYKLVRILWYHIVNKAREIGIFTAKGEDINNRRETLIERSNFEEFVKRENGYKEAIEINPKNARAYIGLGWWHRDQYDKAEEMFKKAIEINPRNDKAYFESGWWYKDQGEYDKAEEMFKKAIEINPRNDKAYFGLGWLYRRQQKYDKAEEMFKKTIKINPTDNWAYGSLAYCYKEWGEYKLAEEHFRKANRLRLEYYNPITRHNHQRLKEIVTQRGIKLVCVQYPVRSIEPLKKMFKNKKGIIFVDNEMVFKKALKQASYDEYFVDIFAGDFGHCTRKGNRLLAENIANVILKECFNIKH